MPPNIQNLKPLTTEKAREIGSKGGKKSVKVRRERKLLSQIYADVIAKQYKANNGSNINIIIQEIIKRKDHSSVSMLKEIREATEGNKLDLSGGVDLKIEVEFVGKSDKKSD